MSLDHVLNARSVAIVGASKVPTKRGYQTIRTLLNEGYEGAIYPVNPKEKSILGLKCVSAVSEIPEEVDVALALVVEYAAEDAEVAYSLYEKLEPMLKEAHLEKLFHEIEMPLVSVLSYIERIGVAVDEQHFTELSKKLKSILKDE